MLVEAPRQELLMYISLELRREVGARNIHLQSFSTYMMLKPGDE